MNSMIMLDCIFCGHTVEPTSIYLHADKITATCPHCDNSNWFDVKALNKPKFDPEVEKERQAEEAYDMAKESGELDFQ